MSNLQFVGGDQNLWIAPEQPNAQILVVVAALPLIDPDHITIRGAKREESDAQPTPRLQMTLDGSNEFHFSAIRERF
jgi:hypothetical protein